MYYTFKKFKEKPITKKVVQRVLLAWKSQKINLPCIIKFEKPSTLPSIILNVHSFNRVELNVGINLHCSSGLHWNQCFSNKVFLQHKQNWELVSICIEVEEKLLQCKCIITVVLPIKIEVRSLLIKDYLVHVFCFSKMTIY